MNQKFMGYISLYFDGGITKNPGGIATWGFIVKDGEFEEAGYGVVGEGEGMTNNVAEYTALIEGVTYVNEFFPRRMLFIFGDSNLVIGAINARNPRKSHLKVPHLRKLVSSFMDEIGERPYVASWIPRDENPADEIEGLALLGV